MCRFVAYKGEPLLMSDLLLKSEHSLVAQSMNALEHSKPVNGDGFGMGWYAPHDDPEPGIFTSIEPAWSNRNLREISKKIRSNCFFAHVRDATPGLPVNQLNCHPFKWGSYMFMHNGDIAGFMDQKRAFLAQLSDKAFKTINGSSDSEFFFAWLLDHLNFKENCSLEEITDGLKNTIIALRDLQNQMGIDAASNLNFALTDGHQMVISRIAFNKDKAPPSLYHACTGQLSLGETGCPSTIIASEPLDDLTHDWQAIEPNTIVTIDDNNQFSTTKLN